MSATLQALLSIPDDAPITLTQVTLLDWGATLVFAGEAGDRAFTLRYADCRDLRWRVYAHASAGVTRLVSFAPGRDQHRSPAQLLTEHFGLSLFYGVFTISP